MFRIRALFLDSGMEDPFALSVLSGTSWLPVKKLRIWKSWKANFEYRTPIHLFPLLIAHALQLFKRNYRTSTN
jgi:hypothetical protein